MFPEFWFSAVSYSYSPNSNSVLTQMKKSVTFRSFEGLMGTIKSRVTGGRELGHDCLPSSAGSGNDPLPVSGSRDEPLPVSGSGNDPVLASRDDLLPFLEPE